MHRLILVHPNDFSWGSFYPPLLCLGLPPAATDMIDNLVPDDSGTFVPRHLLICLLGNRAAASSVCAPRKTRLGRRANSEIRWGSRSDKFSMLRAHRCLLLAQCRPVSNNLAPAAFFFFRRVLTIGTTFHMESHTLGSLGDASSVLPDPSPFCS